MAWFRSCICYNVKELVLDRERDLFCKTQYKYCVILCTGIIMTLVAKVSTLLVKL